MKQILNQETIYIVSYTNSKTDKNARHSGHKPKTFKKKKKGKQTNQTNIDIIFFYDLHILSKNFDN